MKIYNLKGLLITVILLSGAIGVEGQNHRVENVFKAGVSSSDITPPLGLGIVGNYGNPPPARHIHDQLSAKSLVLDDGSQRIVFVVVDNLGLPAWVCEATKDTIHKETGIPVSNILIAATHTHSSVSAGGQGEIRRKYNYGRPFDDYQLFLIRRIADGVRIAINNLRPAAIGWGSFNKPEHVFNRRWFVEDSVYSPLGFKELVVMNPGFRQTVKKVKPAGPTDPEVSFISLKTKEGKPLAVFANYSLHYVGGVPGHDVSADYFGVFARYIEKLLGREEGEPFVAVMSNGTSGDINNNNFSVQSGPLPAYQKMDVIAKDLADGVFEQYTQIKYYDWVPINVLSKTLALNVRKVTDEILNNQQRIAANRGDEPLFHPLERTYADRIAAFSSEYPDKIPVTIQAFSIGDLAISAIPFEVFAETGLELKAKVPFDKVFTVSIANGFWGYLPTPKQHRLGGYETWLTANIVQLDATDIIVQNLLKLFGELKLNKKLNLVSEP